MGKKKYVSKGSLSRNEGKRKEKSKKFGHDGKKKLGSFSMAKKVGMAMTIARIHYGTTEAIVSTESLPNHWKWGGERTKNSVTRKNHAFSAPKETTNIREPLRQNGPTTSGDRKKRKKSVKD